jgi:hypothetical protein
LLAAEISCLKQTVDQLINREAFGGRKHSRIALNRFDLLLLPDTVLRVLAKERIRILN